MEKTEIIKRLLDLIHLEFDAAKIYDSAIKGVDDSVIQERLEEFKRAHHTRAENLSQELRKLGLTPPEPTQDLKGIISEKLTALRSITGAEGALKALKAAEETVSRHYQELVPSDMPPEIHSLLKRHLSDETVHLEYIDLNIQSLSG